WSDDLYREGLRSEGASIKRRRKLILDSKMGMLEVIQPWDTMRCCPKLKIMQNHHFDRLRVRCDLGHVGKAASGSRGAVGVGVGAQRRREGAKGAGVAAWGPFGALELPTSVLAPAGKSDPLAVYRRPEMRSVS